MKLGQKQNKLIKLISIKSFLDNFFCLFHSFSIRQKRVYQRETIPFKSKSLLAESPSTLTKLDKFIELRKGFIFVFLI